jgi:hypothetical protein
VTPSTELGSHLSEKGQPRPDSLRVQISYELIRLLSEQLYTSPAKAIEELVVNAWDADARTCSVYVHSAIEGPDESDPRGVIAVFDDGHGMSEAGLRDLWHVGQSRKRDDDRPVKPKRAQIGKFGIGKLATYAVAGRITYISLVDETLLGVSVDFSSFKATSTGGEVVPVEVDVVAFDPEQLARDPDFAVAARATGQDPASLTAGDTPSWTLVVLEDLRQDALKLTAAKLRWVFSTAMPLESDFTLLLNGNEVPSVDESVEWLVNFDVSDLPDERLDTLSATTGELWKRVDGRLVAPSFPNGVSGHVRVAKESLYRPTTKRSDLGRSHGFFIRVLGRLVNEDDALFGLKPLSYSVFNRLAASLEADDLDKFLTAPREGVERGEEQTIFNQLLNSLFLHARDLYEAQRRDLSKEARRKNEGQRNYVGANLVEHPVADVLASSESGDEDDWFYLSLRAEPEQITALITSLYGAEVPRRTYLYQYDSLGASEPIVRFDPAASRFVLNIDHPIVTEFIDEEQRGRELVEVIATAEALLEIYLREARVPHTFARALLERRDSLLRSLTKDRVFSPKTLARNLREGMTHDKDLEIALVSAMRLLGFSAEHLSDSGNPDGVARYHDGRKLTTLTLEAKSTKEGNAPSLPAIDFAGLAEHRGKADGCLLLAAAYPGDTKEASAAAKRATELRISCWKVEDLSRVVEAAERRHIHARDIIDIVLSKFAPADVSEAVEELLTKKPWSHIELRRTVLNKIIEVYRTVPDADLTLNALAYQVGAELGGVEEREVRDAVEALVAGSAGGLHLSDGKDVIYVRAEPDELRRRLNNMTLADGPPRTKGTLRRDNLSLTDDDKAPEQES